MIYLLVVLGFWLLQFGLRSTEWALGISFIQKIAMNPVINMPAHSDYSLPD
ncbi:hypothetical protein [Photorhabdus caribbeanensis]|uniref:hypothetical protein n=1 Tax=Photorhabdus caribbeanensis TaxID=1004165 RepID=UPI001BD23AB4|nr:hypothetical protein [Photorhabdus caribbeanensis]